MIEFYEEETGQWLTPDLDLIVGPTNDVGPANNVGPTNVGFAFSFLFCR